MMEKPTPALVAEINALRTMHVDELKARYPEILGSAFALCTNCSMLRSEVVRSGRKFQDDAKWS